jgi:hypothetical protein
MSDTVLTWTPSRYTGAYAKLGKLGLFSYSWGSVRRDPKPWKLQSNLPGLGGQEWGFETKEECEVKAEELLSQFAAYLWANGVRFPGQREEDAA